MTELAELDLKIAEALQVDGRASWRKIASVLGENERTVARRGTDLLASGAVSVVALRQHPASVIVRSRTQPGKLASTLSSLTQSSDTSFVYATTGSADVVAEVLTSPEKMGRLVMSELPTTLGIAAVETYPVLKYFRTIRGWRLGRLNDKQVHELSQPHDSDAIRLEPLGKLGHTDEEIVQCLCVDGRLGFEELGARVGVSESTARRKVEWLLETQHLQLRALIEPLLAGLPVEALLWLRVPPADIEKIGTALQQDQRVRYAAVLAGRHQLLVDVPLRTMNELHEFLTDSPWSAHVFDVEVSLVVSAAKRGGHVVSNPSTIPSLTTPD
jgi:DNA-binding Lrp family transcriptional regulator